MRLRVIVLLGCGLTALAGCGKKEESAKGPSLDDVGVAKTKPSVVVYDRSKYSGSGQSGPSDFGPETEEEKAVSQRLLRRLREKPGNRKAQEEVLAEARTLESPLVLPVANEILDSPDADIRAQGLILVDGRTGPEILPLIEKGLNDPELDVRQLAMETALTVRSPAMEKVVMERLSDSDMNIRQTALQAGVNQGGEVAERTLAKGIDSPHEDLGLAALALAENNLTKRQLPSVIGALENPSDEVRETAKDMLYFFFHESFDSRAAAEKWWQANQGLYDNDLVYEGPFTPAK